MSRSDSTGSTFKSALAKSYAILSTKKSQIEKKASHQSSSYILTVEAKIKAAEEKYGYVLEDESSAYTSTEYGGASVNSDPATEATGYDLQEGSMPQSQNQKRRREFAKLLIYPELMWTRFFSEMLEICAQAVEDNMEENDLDLLTSIEVKHSKTRMEHRAATACSLPIKLILTPLNRGKTIAKAFASSLEMQFGPLHASLQVGDLVLEWNDTSLVIPNFCDHKDRVFQVHIEKHSKWIDSVKDLQTSTASAAESGPIDHTEQIFVIAEKKKEIIDSLIEIVVKYNKSYFYNVINRNCQHFVMDCLTALRVKLPDVLATSGLREYYNQVVAGRTPNIPKKFKTHSDLDKYVESQDLTSMPQHDLEFILLMYFCFHIESKDTHAKANRPLNEWKCQESSCLMEEVEQFAEDQSLLIHKFASGK